MSQLALSNNGRWLVQGRQYPVFLRGEEQPIPRPLEGFTEHIRGMLALPDPSAGRWWHALRGPPDQREALFKAYNHAAKELEVMHKQVNKFLIKMSNATVPAVVARVCKKCKL